MATVETVRGGVDTAAMGRTLMHEHVFCLDTEMRANTAGPSKRGQHSQSTEPARLTSAAERQSDSRA